jgi:CrcB protein
MTWLLVGLGGALGTIARHAVSRAIQLRHPTGTFPLAIFLINVAGSLVIGLVSGVIVSGRWHASLEARTFLIVGVLGGFTTFSSFSFDTLALVRGGHHGLAFANVAGQVILSLIGVWLGFRFGARV